jgi:hypothetical protein
VAEHSLTPFGPGVWLDSAPVRIVGMRLTSTMAVLELGERELLLYSPLELTPERRAAVEALGTVAHLYAPNTFHHLWIGAWADAFPNALLHAPAGLREKRPDLRIDRTHGSAPAPAFAGIVDEHGIAGFLLQESVLVHRPTATLIVADLVHNIGRPAGAWTTAYTKMMGFYDRVALSRVIRWTAFPDRAAARRSLDELLTLPFDRLVVGHGTPLETGARESLAAAYAWLR